MKIKIWVLLLFLTAIAFNGCAEADYSTNNGSANAANTNTATAPEKDIKASLIELENKANEAYKNKEGKFFEENLSDSFVLVGDGGRVDRATTAKVISESKCETKSFTISDEDVVELSAGVALITYKIAADTTCEGKALPSPTWAASIWFKEGDKWVAAYHQSTPAADAKGDPPAAPPAEEEAKPAAEEKPAEDPNKDLTAEISKIEGGLWEAWSKKDGKPFEEILTADYRRLLPAGRENKEESIKTMTTQDCKVGSISHSDYSTNKVGDNVVVINYKTDLDAECDGNALAKQHWSSGIYVKDGDKWKSAFFMHTPA